MDLKRYLSEAELALSQPSVGDEFDITINEVFNMETEVLESNEDGITLAMDDRGIAILEELGAFNEEMDKSSGSPYDRGGADAYYGRKFNPHKMVPNPEDPRGRIQQPVTDPAEIAAYEAGWNAEDGRKDYGESDDLNDTPVTEDEHIVQHKTHGAVYGKDGKVKLFMTRGEATAVADEMAKKHGSSGVSVVQGPFTGYMVKMPEGVAEAGMPSGVIRSKQRMAEYTPERMLAKYKEVASRFGEVTPAAIEKLAREEAWRHGYGRMSDHYWKQFKHLVGESVTEANQLSVQQLATISDEALDNAYHYGRSTPGNSFGWQANLMSASYAKKMIDGGVTDIEQIADAIHKGWNVTAQKFVQDPDQFSDTEKLRAAGKLEAKLQQRENLMKINYAQLPEDEKEKDRVVARALLKAITGNPSESISEAEYQGRQVQLGKPTSGDVKKYKVYVRDPKSGNVKKVNFGDKNMEIKRDNPERRKNFRARHNCSDKKDRTKAGYWSCRMWSKKPVSKIV